MKYHSLSLMLAIQKIQRPKKTKRVLLWKKENSHVKIPANFKQSIGTRISGKYHLFADSGYQGIIKFHKNSTIPKKKPRNVQLSKEDKEFNRLLSKYRIYIEHVNNRLKTFKILFMTYRNRRKRYTLRINLIAGIYNYECVNK